MKKQCDVFYDGECPFCTSYVQMQVLREEFEVNLADLRTNAAMQNEMRAKGMDPNEGMLVVIEGNYYYGSDAIWILSKLTARRGLKNKILAQLFSNRVFASRIYPFMKAGRRLALRLLGRKPISDI